jgi:hypothetical protein
MRGFRALALILVAALGLAGEALAQRAIAVAEPESRLDAYPLSKPARGEAADQLAAIFAKVPGLKVVDRGALRQVEKAIAEIALNPVYDDRAKVELGAIVPANWLLVSFVSDVRVEGQYTETTNVLDIDKGALIVDLALRLVDISNGAIRGTQNLSGRVDVVNLVYSKKDKKTRDTESLSMDAALRRSIASAIRQVKAEGFDLGGAGTTREAGGGAPTGATTTVQVAGDDLTCPSARQAGLRKAVEQVVGLAIHGRTDVKDMQFEGSRITQIAEGAIKGYQELGQEALAGGGCRVRLSVEVYEGRVADSVEAMVKDTRAVALFAKSDFAGRSLAVAYATRGISGAQPASSKAAETLVAELRRRFAEYGFDVKLAEASSAGDGAAIAKAAKADAVVLATLSAGEQKMEGGAVAVTASALLSGFDASTGRVFGEAQGRGKRFGAPGTFGSQDAAANAATEAARDGAEQLVKRMIAHFAKRENVLLLTVEDADAKTQEGVEGLLSSNAIDFAIDRQSGTTLVLKITTPDDATAFRQRFRKLAGDAGLRLAATKLEGSTLVFSGKTN